MGKKIKDPVGDRMKRFEMEEAGRSMMPGLPILARLDGRAFHTFTRGLDRPYDKRFMQCMIDTTKALVDEFQADLGYTQSDEITLYWRNAPVWRTNGTTETMLPEMMFDGRYQKWHSLLAADASVAFYQSLFDHLPEKTWLRSKNGVTVRTRPKFDCRVWQLPNESEAFDAFAWREADATRNSLQMLCQAHFSHRQLHGKNTRAQHDMLHDIGLNWNNEPASFKRGTYVRRIVEDRMLTEKELLAIPEKHRPKGPVTRPRIAVLDVPPITKLGTLLTLMCTSKEREHDLD
ncbi:tRNA(His) guanylyltransferase Thg1 family protein [Staphylococcus epidermidis]|jgi:tRNA(His) guanylyltransferase|uniref:tRNA(His) guanylyltransferase Thg1 family protein n=15 Tax=cellular organisms TaxID=131567 RepID=UPI00248038C2|nr:tRNA(His) guanylyltransferase Thg1 family protein [Staphylococcus epidermidis]ELG7156048.1 hypothetical protein [Staphylococcus aureus]HDH7443071.1 hypothetical protein [Escherichia coli]ELL1200966.1 hypothetical protein [Staphylococcus aureus]MDH9287418.1 tRNA(His) guanylyltransferase Thg1 family protein [Staphylococcus epidermidis]MDH9530783.1 tRNA(His) guanylyltransferase Thg1 family protein [Staphylococcus epidermidis]